MLTSDLVVALVEGVANRSSLGSLTANVAGSMGTRPVSKNAITSDKGLPTPRLRAGYVRVSRDPDTWLLSDLA